MVHCLHTRTYIERRLSLATYVLFVGRERKMLSTFFLKCSWTKVVWLARFSSGIVSSKTPIIWEFGCRRRLIGSKI